MKIIEEVIECNGRGDRVEIFPFYDTHVGKANCNELAIRKEVQEIVRRDKMKNRHVRVLGGGDLVNAISSNDRRRFDFADVADWVVKGPAKDVKNALADMPDREIKRLSELMSPISHLFIGALEGNHERALRKYHNMDVQMRICEALECENLTDEAIIRFKFRRSAGQVTSFNLYMRHGYGGGRSAGSEYMKLAAMLSEWECADVCLSGHTHTFAVLDPKAVAMMPIRGDVPDALLWKHRFAANPGCWLDSHAISRGTYESNSCYQARAFMTCKIVVWPFFDQYQNGRAFATPKLEIRAYPIL